MKYKKSEDIEQQGDENAINLRDLLSPYLYRWPVFIIAVLLTCSVAYVYLRYSKSVYQINSLLLIKDDKKSNSNNQALEQLDLFSSSKVVDNEIEIIKSKPLMAEVLDRLHLGVALRDEGRVITIDVYNNRPVMVKTVKINSEYYEKNYTLSFPNPHTFLLQNQLSGESFRGELGKLQHNKIGTFIISAMPSFKQSLHRSFQFTFLNPISLVDNYVSRLHVEASSPQSTVLKISLSTTVPERGKDVVNSLIQVYNEASLADKNKTVKNTIDFINERLKLITVELNDVEKDVEVFKSSRGLTDISGEASLFLESVKTNDTKLNEVNLKLGVVKNIQGSLKEEFKQQKLPSTLGIEDPLLVEQIGQLYALESQKVGLLASLPATNPAFNPINEQIRNLKSNISSSLSSLEKTLLNMRNALNNYNSRYEGSIKKIPGQEREFISIKRQQSIKENLYLFLLQKKEEAVLSYASAAADTRIVEPAGLPLGPIAPNRNIIILSAFALGLFLAFFYVYTRELLNNRVRSASGIKRLTPVPILGEIAQQEDGELVTFKSRSAISEQLRSLRTNLQYLSKNIKEKEGRVTLLTSSMSGEGKSFVACNIAVIHALSGKKTVLLELDLRKPKIRKYLNLKTNIGLSNYLIGHEEVEKIIQPLEGHPNLSIIGSGPVPPNPSELLIGAEMETLIKYLKANYDEIVIDTPPVGLVTDAQILGKFADISLFLVRQGVTFRSQMANITDLQEKNKLPNLSIVLNGVKLAENYGYGYYGEGISRKMSFISYLKNFKKRLI